MTEDHKITNYSERLQIEETGEPLKDGETRLYGMKNEKTSSILQKNIHFHFPDLKY